MSSQPQAPSFASAVAFMILNDIFLSVGLFTLATPSFALPHNTGPKDHGEGGFIKFQDFISGVTDATYDKWAHTAVQNSTAFQEMRSHILNMYDGIGEVTHSFVYDNEYGDCVDVNKQPSLRLQGIDHIAPTPLDSTCSEKGKGGHGPQVQSVDSPLKLDLKDSFGNVVFCRNLTIPFARLTLEKLTTFRTLDHFFSKGNDTEPAIGDFEEEDDDGHSSRRELTKRGDEPHLYAVAGQYTKNFGGNSWLNLWNPVGDFSLSQQWYVGGSGDNRQTVEGGWVVYPNKFKTKNAVLFIFYTADNYKKKKCWNLDCAAFVQTNKNWFLGRGFTHYSASGGGQWGFEMQWKLVGGNWWLYLKGPGAYEAVGYYPTKLYGTGQLSKYAEKLEYGGEVTRDAGHVWPQMGSSALPSTGFSHAAYQHTIYYTLRDEPGGVGAWAALSPTVIGSTSCWNINVTQAAVGDSWGTHFYYGGPGGKTCN